MDSRIKNFFYPDSICIAGASSKKGNIGYEITAAILNYGYKGDIILINPKAEEILGIKCLAAIKEVNRKVDLAIILVPKAFAEENIRELLEKNVKSFILITAGFKETGKEGENAEKRITDMLKSAGGRMTGPNCMGVINTLNDIKLNATFVAEKPETGSTAFLSQSGALGAAVLNSLRETDIRFAHFVSVGNKADLNENDFIDFWEEDPNIKVMTLYLESFSDGEGLIQKFAGKHITKPVIILKAGSTGSGMKAAASHTGALGSSDKAVDAVIGQFGLLRADNLTELFNTAKGFENFPPPAGNRTAVLTNAGGPAILAVDMLERKGLVLAEISPEIKKQLREIVHPEGSVLNPVDLLPGGDAEAYKKCVELLVKDKNIDAVVSIFVEPVMVKALGVIEGINSVITDKPVLQVVMPLPEFWENYKQNSEYNKPLFRYPEEPAVVLSNMLRFNSFDFSAERIRGKKQRTEQKFEEGFLSKEQIESLGRKYNLPILSGTIIDFYNLKMLDLDFPLVLKSYLPDVVHKSELQGVITNIRGRKELIASSEKMRKAFKEKGYNLEQFMLQPFIETRFELLLGGFRDPDFGPMVMFGSGGKYVEIYQDVKMYSAYLSDKNIDEVISGTRMGKLLCGVRGESPADINKLKEIIRSIALMMIENPDIQECDLNPLILTPDNKYIAVDVRVKIGS